MAIGQITFNIAQHMNHQIGLPAPEFTLFNSEKQEISLRQFRGKNVVLLFIPQAFTGKCTEELCSVRDTLSEFESLNAEVLSISVDSIFTLDHWKQQQSFNFQMLSDFNKDVSKAYDSYIEDFVFGMKGVSKRAVFVIDGQGIVRHAEITENPGLLPDINQIKEVLNTLA